VLPKLILLIKHNTAEVCDATVAEGRADAGNKKIKPNHKIYKNV
jgi:hypothetical protein